MSKRFSSFFLGPLLCAGLLPADAQAQTEPKGLYATLYGQYSKIGSSTVNETGARGAGNSLRAEFDSGSGWGGDIGWRYGNGWAAELEWNYRSHSLNGLRLGGANFTRDGDFASNILMVNGLRRFPSTSTWTPYLGAGIGWVQEIDIDVKPDTGGTERSYSASSKFAFQLIAGVEYALTPQWRMTADARWLRVGSVRLDNEVGNSGGTVGPLTYNPLSVQVGVRYSF
ncbi:outer membrane protein [Piscinibacterium candidicorallinum]|uniref:Outer membrane protein n=1 Tax=Piscinibacterium candidicorallinum TaxID=1793872 RepID=A0ABV7H661_9BURK